MRYFVTGTDTDVGKTQVAAGLLSAMARAGQRPFAWKPFESGGTGDAERLWRAAGAWQPRESVCLYRLAEPLAPSMAAAREGVRIDWARVLRAFRGLGDGPGVVEGAGGLHVPVTARRDVIDLVEALELPVVLVARAGLGTINHTSLSLEALRARRVPVAAVVLSVTSPMQDLAVRLNRDELQRRYPRVRFLGPVAFLPDEARRHRAMQRALAPLV